MNSRASKLTASKLPYAFIFFLLASCGENFHLKETVPAIGQALPTATIVAPNVNSLNANNYTASGTCSEDGTGNLRITLQSIGPLTANCVGGTWSITGIDVSSLGDGVALVAEVTITDGLGQTSNGQDSFDKDTALPTVSVISAPGINSINQANFGVVKGSCSEVGREVVVQVGGISSSVAPILCVSDPLLTGACSTVGTSPCWTASSFDVSSLPEGVVSITAVHDDALGNSSNDSGTIPKDSIAPSITISANHITQSNQSAYNNDTYISGTCSEIGTSNVRILIDTLGPFTTDCTDDGSHVTGTWSLSGVPAAADVSSIANGTGYIAAASISDTSGNTGMANDTFNKDTTLSVSPLSSITYANMTNVAASGTCGSAATHGASLTLTVSRIAPSASIDFPATCVAGAWSLTGLDLSSLADDVALAFTISQLDIYSVASTATQNSNVLDVYPPMGIGNTSITDEHLVKDSSGNTYAVYTFTSATLDLGNDINQNHVVLTRSGSRDLIIAKYNPSGALVGTTAVQSNSGAGKIILKGAQVDPNDELIVIGEYDGSIDATAKEILTGSGTTTNYNLVNAGAGDAFILKLNSDSTFNYIKTFNDAAGDAFFYTGNYWSPGAASFKNYDYIINFDSNNNAVFGVVYFGSSLTLNDVISNTSQLIMSSASDYSVFSFDQDGAMNFHLDFITSVGGVAILPNHLHDNYTQRIYIDTNDNLYVHWGVGGGASGTAVKDASGSTVANTTTHGNWMTSLAKFNSAGQFGWGVSIREEGNGTSHAGQVVASPTGETYLTFEFGAGAVSSQHYDIFDLNGALLKSIRKTADINYDGSGHGCVVKFSSSGAFEWVNELGWANQGLYSGLEPMRQLFLDSSNNPVVIGGAAPSMDIYRTSDVPVSLATNELIVDYDSDYTGGTVTGFQFDQADGRVLWGKAVTTSNGNYAAFTNAFQDNLGRFYLFLDSNFGGLLHIYDITSAVGVKTEIATRNTTGYNSSFMRFDNPNSSNTLDYVRMVRGVAPGAYYGARIANVMMSPAGVFHIGVRTLYSVWPNSGFEIVDESDNVLGSTTATNVSIDSGMFKVTDTGAVPLSVSIKGDGATGDTLLQQLAVDASGHASKLVYSTSTTLNESEVNKTIPGDTQGRWFLIP